MDASCWWSTCKHTNTTAPQSAQTLVYFVLWINNILHDNSVFLQVREQTLPLFLNVCRAHYDSKWIWQVQKSFQAMCHVRAGGLAWWSLQWEYTCYGKVSIFHLWKAGAPRELLGWCEKCIKESEGPSTIVLLCPTPTFKAQLGARGMQSPNWKRDQELKKQIVIQATSSKTATRQSWQFTFHPLQKEPKPTGKSFSLTDIGWQFSACPWIHLPWKRNTLSPPLPAFGLKTAYILSFLVSTFH